MPIQIFFVICGLVAIIGVGPFTYYCYSYIDQAFKNKPDDYDFPDWRDFKWTLLSIAIISIVDFIAHKVLNKLFRPLCKIQDDIEERDRRTEKAAYSGFKLLYFLAVSVWGFVILHNKQFFPSLLGGTGDFHKCSQNYPYQHPDTREGIFWFLVLQLGFHVQAMIRMFVYQEKTKDIFEMTLHEIVTIYLYGGCYLMNFWEIGAVISWLHSVSDILIMLSKILSQTEYGISAAVVFLIEMMIWFYTRLIVFPWIAWIATTQDIDLGHWLILPFFGYGLYCLVFLHAYWFYLFV